MKLDGIKFGAASAICAAVLWIVCSLLVTLAPSAMMSMSGHMVHMQLDDLGWHLTLFGVVSGLVAWTVLAGVTGWLLAVVYNRLLSD